MNVRVLQTKQILFSHFYEENADLTDDIINDIHVYHNRLGAVVTDIAQLEQEEYGKTEKSNRGHQHHANQKALYHKAEVGKCQDPCRV